MIPAYVRTFLDALRVFPRGGRDFVRNQAVRPGGYRPRLEALESRLTPSLLLVDQGHGNCSDSGSGTSAQPFCTISAAAARAVAGDTVNVASGTYREQVTVRNSGISTSHIVFSAAQGASVTVTGGKHGFLLSGRLFVTIRGFRITQTTDDGINIINSSNITIEANDISFAGQPAVGQTGFGIRLSGTNSTLVASNVVHHNNDSGIFLTGGTTTTTVRGNESFNNARGFVRAAAGIDVRSAGNTIIGNRTHHNEDTGIQIRSAQGTTEAANNAVINNISYDNGDHGMDALRAPGQVFTGNVIYNNIAAGINIEDGSTGCTLTNNISVDNAINSPRTEGNIRVDGSSTSGTTLDYNLVWMRSTAGAQEIYIWGAARYFSLDDFAAATGMEDHGIQADPLWVAPGSGDFRVKPGSPAIDSADSRAPGHSATDANGNPRLDDPSVANTGAGPRSYDDRGALEFQPPPPRGSVRISVAGDGQTFALDSKGSLWRYTPSDNRWLYSGFGGLQIAVSNVGDGNPDNDLVFLRGTDGKIWSWTGVWWTFSGGYLPNIIAGDNQVFGIGFDGQVWRFNVHTGWTASGGYGAEIAIGTVGDGNSANDVVFLRSTDNRIWVWTQTSWSFTGGWLPRMTAGDDQIFSIGLDGQLWRFHVRDGWSASGGYGVGFTLGNLGDGTGSNDLVFLKSADNRIWLWNQRSWSFTGGYLSKIQGGDNQVFGIGLDSQLWRFHAHNGWSPSGGFGIDLDIGSDGDGNAANDVVFLITSDRTIWFWNQAAWAFTGA